jgi:calcineurin-like phosphoesterase
MDAWEKPELQGVFLDIADSGKANSIERIRVAAPPIAGQKEEEFDDGATGD